MCVLHGAIFSRRRFSGVGQRGNLGLIRPMSDTPRIEYVTTQQAIALTGLSGSAIGYHVKSGRLKQYMHPGDKRRRLYDRAELLAFIADSFGSDYLAAVEPAHSGGGLDVMAGR